MIFPDELSTAVLYEQLAEEAIELAHAAQKLARGLRNENPLGDGVYLSSLYDDICEEWVDVYNVIRILEVPYSEVIGHDKMKRWARRLNKAPESDKEKGDHAIGFAVAQCKACQECNKFEKEDKS